MFKVNNKDTRTTSLGQKTNALVRLKPHTIWIASKAKELEREEEESMKKEEFSHQTEIPAFENQNVQSQIMLLKKISVIRETEFCFMCGKFKSRE